MRRDTQKDSESEKKRLPKKSREIVEKDQTTCIEGLEIKNKDLTMQKADASCKSVLTIPKMQSGGGWNLSTLNTQPKHATLRQNREKTNIGKTALLQALRIQGS